MKNFIHIGKTLSLTAPAGGVVSGQLVKVGQLHVVAVASAAAGETFEGRRDGVFTLPKKAADNIAQGALLYWDNALGHLTTSATAGFTLVGAAEVAAGAATTEVQALLDGVLRAANA